MSITGLDFLKYPAYTPDNGLGPLPYELLHGIARKHLDLMEELEKEE